MNAKVIAFLFLSALAFTWHACGQTPERLPILGAPAEQVAQGKTQPKDKDKDKKIPDKKSDTPVIDFSAPPTRRSELATGYHPQMMGDYFGYFTFQRLTVFGTQTTTTTTTAFPIDTSGPPVTTTTTTTNPTAQTRTILVPIASVGVFKVAENASPRPQDRVYFTYNYFSNLQAPLFGPTAPFTSTTSNTTNLQVRGFPVGTVTTTTNTFIPPAPIFRGYLHREVFGFEKTFLDGYASIEVRLPLLQQAGTLPGFGSQYIGDMTFIGKYAFILDQVTGNVLSGGLAVTAPTGPDFLTTQGTFHSTYFQPWGGYIWNYGPMFVQGFHSIVVPTDARDVTLLFNDVGLYYWLYRGQPDRLLSFVVPTVETHVTTPLNQRGFNGSVYAPDLVVLTGGVHLGLFGNSTLSFGIATPVTGPRLFGVEAFAQFNWRF